MWNKILYNLKTKSIAIFRHKLLMKLIKDINMNIFLVIKNIEYLLNFYVFLFIIFGEKNNL